MQDPEFFEFYRSMQSYRTALGETGTTMVLSPDSEFFRYFGGNPGVNVGNTATGNTADTINAAVGGGGSLPHQLDGEPDREAPAVDDRGASDCGAVPQRRRQPNRLLRLSRC